MEKVLNVLGEYWILVTVLAILLILWLFRKQASSLASAPSTTNTATGSQTSRTVRTILGNVIVPTTQGVQTSKEWCDHEGGVYNSNTGECTSPPNGTSSSNNPSK